MLIILLIIFFLIPLITIIIVLYILSKDEFKIIQNLIGYSGIVCNCDSRNKIYKIYIQHFNIIIEVKSQSRSHYELGDSVIITDISDGIHLIK